MEFKPIIRIDPLDNMLVGLEEIQNYLRIKSYATFVQLVELYGLPATKTPDGRWITTMTAIDQWIFLAAEADAQNRTTSRGSNVRIERQAERLQRRIESARSKAEPPAKTPSDV